MRQRLAAWLLAVALCAPVLASCEAADTDAFRGIPWTAAMEAVAEAEDGSEREEQVVVTGKDLTLYDLRVMRLSYQFEDGRMTSRAFLMHRSSEEAFTSLFYSLFLRYGFPVIAEEQRAVWQTGALRIDLARGEDLTVTYHQNATEREEK